MAGIEEFYRRTLPSPAIEFASLEGKQLFYEALPGGNMEGFFKLISYYQTQSEPAYCGLATLSMVLNALAIDPGRKWKGPWRWFEDSMLDCCESLEKVKVSGLTFDKVHCLAYCNGVGVKAFHTNESTIEDFRSYVVSCTSSEDCHLIVSYHRGFLEQTGSGHFSPVGGYHREKDLVLILDVARFKYPPHWVPLTLLWKAMNTVDQDTGLHRGFMVLMKPKRAPSVLYTNCLHKSCETTAKYLTKKLPQILSSDKIKDVQCLLANVMCSAPSDLKYFISWATEVHSQEDGTKLSKEQKARLSLQEEVLEEVHKAELFDHMKKILMSKKCCKQCEIHSCKATKTKFLKDSENHEPIEVVSAETYCQVNTNNHYPSLVDVVTILLLALPPQTWLNIKDEGLKEEINRLTTTTDFSPLLQEEVLHLQQQLHLLSKSICICSP